MAIFKNFWKKKISKNDDLEITNPRGISREQNTDIDRNIIEANPLDENRVFGLTDVGKIRNNNEDFFVINPEIGIYIVADGMGGHNAGEVASEEACKTVLSYFKKHLNVIKFDRKNLEDTFWTAMQEANSTVFSMARDNTQYRGMGTTLILALIHEEDLYVSHVGDVRAYLWHQGSLEQLTEDHSVIWQLVKAGEMTKGEARLSNMKNQITQAVGIGPTIAPSFGNWTLEQGDKLMLCSDGLWDMLPDEHIAKIVGDGKSARKIAEELMHEANKAGGQDNITLIVYLQ